MSNATQEEIEQEFSRHIRLCSGLGHSKMLRMVDTYFLKTKQEEFRDRVNNLTCRCGHPHDRHGGARSVNYTAGQCFADETCDCENFIISNQ